MKIKKILSGMAFAFTASLFSVGSACTSLAITDHQHNIYHGRTLELSAELPSWVGYYPKNTIFQKHDPSGKPGLKYSSKYDILFISTNVYNDGDDHNILQGVNSAGLSFSENMVPIANLTALDKRYYKDSIPVTALGEWALSNFATVEEVRAAVGKAHFWSPILEAFGGVEAPLHYAIYDQKGGSIVLEIKDGKLEIYDNPTRVLTNGPEFPWHLTNLNNYTQLSNIDHSTAKLGNMEISQPDSGIASTTLPSSDTSVGRFIRAVYYSSYAPIDETSAQAMNTLAHVMNRFDRMKNITADTTDNNATTKSPIYSTEYTVWTSLTDLTNKIMMVRPYGNINYTTYDFEQFQDQSEPLFIKIN
ncbi:linear amide C-N hydrolase [Ignatzschineria sp. LJL83]